ncbi:MAG TPA: glycosyltransferase family 1 protein [Acidimicrobiia bacterium]|nr:glycosyltransferase family 1 protein [Acidimicrobiia bacterium]
MSSEPRLRVALDATSSLGVRTGVGNVAGGLLEHLAARTDLDVTAFAITWRGRNRLAGTLPPSVHAATRRFPARLTRALWPRIAWPRVERWTGPVDVVHSLHVAPPARAPVLLTVHDLTHIRYPELSSPEARHYPRLVQVAVDRGATIHTYSQFVAAEVRDHYRLPAERVVTIAPGLDARPTGDAARGRGLAGSERYVLAVGTVEPRKNLPTLVRAFDALAATDRDLALVVAGPDGWGVQAFRAAVARAGHGDRVRRPGWLDDRSRDDLLAGASVLAYPSVYEGFGLPPLEAMRAGIPVVASNAGPLPEVLGDAALLIDPGDADELASALARVLDDEQLRRQLSERGRARVARYGWDGSVERFAATYRALGRR